MLDNKIYINGFSIVAPGLESIDTAIKVLNGMESWAYEDLSKMVPISLPPNEARRTTRLIRLALRSIQQLSNNSFNSVVFASSEGDLDITDKICKALSTSEKMVSPTLFHNSVHNAPAGYFSIAESAQSPSVSLSSGDYTFSSGLLEALTQVSIEKNDVLLVSYDNTTPSDLDNLRHFDYPLSVSLLLSPKKTKNTIGDVSVILTRDKYKTTKCFNDSLNILRSGNPSGVCLPLIEALVGKLNTDIILPYINNNKLLVKVNHA